MKIPIDTTLPKGITFATVSDDDFEELLALRIAAMRESLEAVGRFNPERARERLRKSFYPEHTAFIVVDGERIGFYTFRPIDGGGLQLDHLYVHPNFQSRGIGSEVLRHLLALAYSNRTTVSLDALRDSPSNRFYQRHSFVKTAEDEWDIYYLWTPPQVESGNSV